jgi:hypothetical protein
MGKLLGKLIYGANNDPQISEEKREKPTKTDVFMGYPERRRRDLNFISGYQL